MKKNILKIYHHEAKLDLQNWKRHRVKRIPCSVWDFSREKPTSNGRTLKMLKAAFKSSKNIQKLDLICPQHAQMTEKGIHIIGENIKKLKSLK